jgi:hypothetical protein
VGPVATAAACSPREGKAGAGSCGACGWQDACRRGEPLSFGLVTATHQRCKFALRTQEIIGQLRRQTGRDCRRVGHHVLICRVSAGTSMWLLREVISIEGVHVCS